MSYFVTGGTGFIGRFLIDRLLEREGTIFVLVRRNSVGKLDALRARWGAHEKRVVAVVGDLARPKLGVSAAGPREDEGPGEALLPPRRDLRPRRRRREPAEGQHRRHAPRRPVRRGGPGGLLPPRELHRRRRALRRRLPRGHVRGGRGTRPPLLPHQARLRGHRAQANARGPGASTVPRIVVGHSKTGEIDKIDGPYYFFKLIQKMRKALPQWMPTVGHRGRAHQHRAGGLRRRCDGPHRAQEGAGRRLLPPDRPGAAPHRRDPQPLRQGRARAADDDAAQREDVRLHPGLRDRFGDVAGARAPHPEAGPRRPGHPEGHVQVRQLPDPLRQPRMRQGAQGLGDLGAPPGGLRLAPVGLLGDATSIPTSSSTARSPAR